MKNNTLWENIKNFKLDNENAEFKFSQRLARDNNWSIAYSLDVIEEYKKFIYLCCISENQITPSDAVDQVWHLHMTYTQSYWKNLCRDILEKEIHHNPTEGGNSERKKYSNCYDLTFKIYEKEFKTEPPKLIWLSNETRFKEINFKRVNVNQYWMIKKPTSTYITAIKLLFIGIIVPLLFIRAKDNFSSISFVIIITIFLIAKYLNGGNKNNRDNDSGCSDGCSFNDDSGCSSGCSGCGGCGD